MTHREQLVIDVFGEMAGAVVRDAPHDAAYEMLAACARTLVDADLVTVTLRRDDGMLYVPVVDGFEADLRNALIPADTTNGRVIASGQPLMFDDLSTDESANAKILGLVMGPAVFLPLAADEPFGSLNVFRYLERPPFTEGEKSLLVTLATKAGLVLGHAARRERIAERERVAEREQIATDLQHVAVDKIFSASLVLSSVVRQVREPNARDEILEVIEDLDAAIKAIRQVAFGLKNPPPET